MERQRSRGRTCDRQADAVLRRKPDLVALQELTLTSEPLWRALLVEAGFEVLSTADILRGRKYCNLIASRWPIERIRGLRFRNAAERETSYPAKYLAVHIGVPRGGLELHVAHVPPGSSVGIGKVIALEAIHRRIVRATQRPIILCGDFNTPKHETRDGRIETWGSRHRERERWERAELGILCGLQTLGLRDVYRGLHGYRPQPASWTFRNVGRRYDHVFSFGPCRPCRASTSTHGGRTGDSATTRVSKPHSSANRVRR